jgi:hypothetical protein
VSITPVDQVVFSPSGKAVNAERRISSLACQECAAYIGKRVDTLKLGITAVGCEQHPRFVRELYAWYEPAPYDWRLEAAVDRLVHRILVGAA